MAPATVRTVAALKREYPALGEPVRMDETLVVLRGLLGE
jgi:hypothetical protein